MTSDTASRLTVYMLPGAVSNRHKGVNGRNRGLLFHEALHGFGGASTYGDADLKKAFGIPSNAPSGRISQYISKNCK